MRTQYFTRRHVWNTLTYRNQDKVIERHEHIHGVPEPPHRCSECGEGFFDLEAWQNHHREEHAPDVPSEPSIPAPEYECGNCGLAFFTIEAWQLHHEENHFGPTEEPQQ